MINAMFLKTVCSFALCAGGGYCGIVFASRYDTGINQLKSFVAALKAMNLEISMNNTVLCEALCYAGDAAGGTVKDIFDECAKRIRNSPGDDVYNLWCACIDKYKSRLCISETDIKTIKNFGRTLGLGDREEESSNIKSAVLKLELAEDSAMEKKARNAKLYRSLGFASGILISVLLL